MNRYDERIVHAASTPRRINRLVRPRTGGDRDPDHLYRTCERAQIAEWVGTLLTCVQTTAHGTVPRRDRRRKGGALFSASDRDFVMAMHTQLARFPEVLRPLTGKQLVLVKALLEMLAKDTGALVEQDDG